MSQSEQNVVVLVADDEPSTLALVASHVRSKGYKVLEASDGDQAWQLAHEHLPDLVILDVMMPGMSGWELCHKIRETVSLAHTGVIMLTGIGENLNEMTSPLYGADAYLDKPFEFSVLDERIAETLVERRQGTMGRPAETVDAASAYVAHHNGAAAVEPAAELREQKAHAEKPASKRPPSTTAASATPDKGATRRNAAPKPAAPVKPPSRAKAAPQATTKGKNAKRAPTKKAAANKATAKAKATTKKAAAKKATAKKAAAGKATSKKASAKKAGTKKSSPKKPGGRAKKRAAAKAGKTGKSGTAARKAPKPTVLATKKSPAQSAKKATAAPRSPAKAPGPRARAKSNASGDATV